MKLTNKKIIAILLAAATLTACDGLNGSKKEAENTEKPAVEESQENKEAETKEETDADKADSEEKDAEKKEGEEDSENADQADADKEEAVTYAGQSTKEKLEDAVFNNRVQARAAEILLEQTPETITNIKDKLETLVEESNALIEKAEKALESL
ncbi:hypothetical protein NH286_08390 [Anaerococcus sp. NML200574]|uniref:hypothetical protein n=1 Tax=Anaerococcus sp. NML200574 TaxID=2954486 RepID=UPI002238CC23|nr:hypothetical protein [Anaerococcus sp. NML200574]MCW6679172.1 hypothetical protein [Anaerococcus sp. NML200574]